MQGGGPSEAERRTDEGYLAPQLKPLFSSPGLGVLLTSETATPVKPSIAPAADACGWPKGEPGMNGEPPPMRKREGVLRPPKAAAVEGVRGRGGSVKPVVGRGGIWREARV